MSPKGDKVEVDQENAHEEVVFEAVEVTFDEIAVRAYEIHVSDAGGGEVENWLRAEKELEEERRLEQKLSSEQTEPDEQTTE